MSRTDYLDVLALKKLKDLARREGGREVIPFLEFHASLASFSNVSEVETWGVLKSMEEDGLIEIDPFDGIRLNV